MCNSYIYITGGAKHQGRHKKTNIFIVDVIKNNGTESAVEKRI